jgi:methionyl aminopeptidase
MNSLFKKSLNQINQMREAGKIASCTLLGVGSIVKAGISTGDIDRFVYQDTINRGAIPAPLGFNGYPKSVCTSRNHVVCHGIPCDVEFLENGDIINVDITSIYKGYHSDTSATFYVGTPSIEAKHVVEVARRALDLGIKEAKIGAHIGNIGFAIQEFTRREGCSVIERFDGHGIGESFHELPWIKHYGEKGTGLILEESMTFTIEPLIILGDQAVDLLDDGWSMVSRDGSLSAQFEHTILTTPYGPEILTQRHKLLKNSEIFTLNW